MGIQFVRWALCVGLGSQLLLVLPLFPLAIPDFPAVEAAKSSFAPVQTLAGADWNEWHNDKKIVFVNGFISGSQWVAVNSMFPESMFSEAQARTGAQMLWDKATAEFEKAIDNPQAQLTRQYTAKDIMLYAMFDGYKKNELYKRAVISVQAGTIVSQLDQLYAKSANLKVPISGAIYLAKKITSGASKDDVDTLLPYLRGDRTVPSGWIIPVYDKTGKYVKVIEFP